MISITKATPLENYTLELCFNTGEKGIFDMRPYLEKGIFTQLKDMKIFQNLKIQHKTVTWCEGELDISPNTLYLHSVRKNS